MQSRERFSSVVFVTWLRRVCSSVSCGIDRHRLAFYWRDVPFHAGYVVCHWPSSYEVVLVVNVDGPGGGVVGEGGGDDDVIV